jgi:hypothetical protein
MKRVTVIATALVLAVVAVLAGRVAAQETNASERTFLTFSSAVELPGLTLQPGTYVFKLADTSSRNVVQVWNQNEDQMLGHWLFVQAERPEVTDENVVLFKETAAGSTPAVQYWYFPGERIGKEFVYPKDQATKIAARTGSSVLTGDGEVSSVESIDAQGNVTPWQKEDRADASAPSDSSVINNAPASAQPSAPAGSLAGNRGVETQPEARAEASASDSQSRAATHGGAAEADVQADARRDQSDAARSVGTSGVQAESQVARADELPRTASPLALSGLIGLLSLAGAAGVRALRQ